MPDQRDGTYETDLTVLNELWRCGGPLFTLITKSITRAPQRALEDGGLLDSELRLISSLLEDDLAGSLLIDTRGTVWLTQFGGMGATNPIEDAASFITALLIQYYTMPVSFEEIASANAQRLQEALGLHAEAIGPFVELCAECADRDELAQRLEQEEEEDEAAKDEIAGDGKDQAAALALKLKGLDRCTGSVHRDRVWEVGLLSGSKMYCLLGRGQ